MNAMAKTSSENLAVISKPLNDPTICDSELGSEEKRQCEDHEKDKVISAQTLAEIPDGGYGWFIVLACFLLNFNTWGANSGFAVYLSTYLNEDTFDGASKYDYALIGGMTFGVGLVFAPVVNWTQGKLGIQLTIILGMCFQFAGLMLASFSKKLWQLYLTQGMLQAFGLAFMSIPAMAILPQWFKKKRTFAAAISAAGSGCGGIMYNLAMQKVIEIQSVSWALRAQSILCFGLSWISIALIRTRMQVKFSLFDVSVLKTAGFYIATFYVVFCMLGYVVVLYNMANFTTSLGYSEYQGSIASAMVQVGSVLGRPVVGRISDVFGAITVTCAAYFLSAVFVFALWVPAKNYAMIIVFCIIEGSLMGLIFATIAPICAKLFGLKRVNVSLGMLWIFLGFSGIASPVIGLSLKTGGTGYVGSDQYLHCSIFSGAAFVACFATLLIMRGYVIHRQEMVTLDADEGHMHVTVPFLAPFYCALKPVAKI
ncbi:MFS general substrate transporter [Metschnikowia bicuspidata var. bicuspidata NRRL YB-4993]|uniref:MFS general substrate transporter n=1 Tax=Metschnikowia bicuspidata var. bicuspidata NRRL YB-4993 TaxID=869754 RepID=A0A1A0H5D6_9ASCO|nr:MFS general substrate transporter [Metschnikowia bicuspidata var. bicuspidata NRRL YB-4993]OBA19133.1 MFS general substrate transporter [Metschnikowia bicuspidata var. bicuspidata NRRL YB-4993]